MDNSCAILHPNEVARWGCAVVAAWSALFAGLNACGDATSSTRSASDDDASPPAAGGTASDPNDAGGSSGSSGANGAGATMSDGAVDAGAGGMAGDGGGGDGASGGGANDGAVPPLGCNGAPELCERRYDEVAHPTTHNAMSNADDGWLAPNQTHGISQQLEDGVRGLMLDVHEYEGQPELCHGYCLAGHKPLVDGLEEIADFLSTHPREVLTIIFESYVPAEAVAGAFESAGLTEWLHVQSVDAPWPTLDQMIGADTRLVVFTDNGGGTYPWYHDVWEHAFETHFSYESAEDMSCDLNRGTPGNALFILNHFLTGISGSPTFAEQVNPNPFFIERALECEQSAAHLPNFPTVDFYDIGDLFAVTRELNGLEP